MQIFAMNRPYRPTLTSAQKRELRDNLNDWLTRPGYTHFVTLATNAEAKSPDRMRRLLKHWDARVNKDLISSRWRKKPDERTIWCAFGEKFDVNAHWHLLLQTEPDHIKMREDVRLGESFEDMLRRNWVKLVPSGTSEVQAICEAEGAIRYVTKAVERDENWTTFIHCFEFRNN